MLSTLRCRDLVSLVLVYYYFTCAINHHLLMCLPSFQILIHFLYSSFSLQRNFTSHSIQILIFVFLFVSDCHFLTKFLLVFYVPWICWPFDWYSIIDNLELIPSPIVVLGDSNVKSGNWYKHYKKSYEKARVNALT